MNERVKQLLVLGREHYGKREFEKAEQLLRMVLEEEDRYADVHDMLGVIAHSRGNFLVAERHFERALEINPSYTEAALRLQVTPQITVEGTIFLNVDVENTTPDFGRQVSGNPSLITQQATTQVLVTDGGTVVIGGVIQTQNSVSTTQIPLLGDIPVLGNLFKRRAVSTSTQELIFFITPKIVQT